MAKAVRGDFAMPVDQRAEAMALLTAIRSGAHVEARNAAQQLLETAVFMTHLVEWAWYIRTEVIRDASRDYPVFPILISAMSGRDTRQKLRRIRSLPIGEHWPFKPLHGPARNDDLRSLIESGYEAFRNIQLGAVRHVSRVDSVLVKKVRRLPKLNQQSAREWAISIAHYCLTGPGGGELLRVLHIDQSKETAKKRRRKEARLRVRYGGRELDSIEETWLEYKTRAARMTPQTLADQENALIDAVEKRLRSILKE